MSATYLTAAAARLVDVAAPDLTADDVFVIFTYLDLRSRLCAAQVSKTFLEASRRPELYAICDKALLSRVASTFELMRFATLLGPCTRELCLANMRALNDEDEPERNTTLLRDLLSHSESYREAGRIKSRKVPRMANLEALDVSANELSDAAMFTIAGLIQSGVPLRRLYLWATEGVSNEGITRVAQSGGGGGTRLEVVDLRMCGSVTGAGVCKLAKGCPLLVDLRLKGLKGIDDATFAALAEHCPLLTCLDASGASNQLTDAGVARLSEGCPRLEQVHLAGAKKVGDGGVVALASRCHSLQLLDLQGCATCGDGAALALATHSKALHTVSFQCCANLSDAGFVELCNSCPLRHVTIKLCKVTAAAVAEMRAVHAAMTIVDFGEANRRKCQEAGLDAERAEQVERNALFLSTLDLFPDSDLPA